MTHLDADEYRVEGEKATLRWGFAVLAILIVFATAATFGFALLAVVGAAIVVWIKQGQLLGQSAKVSKSQFPDLHQIVSNASGNLGIHPPPIFIEQNPSINAFAMGFLGTKSVVVHSATIEAMTPTELTFIVGHEFSHIKCGHTNMGVLTNSSGALQIPFVSWLLGLIFQAWSRKAEYTCDRGGLLACRDLKSAIAALCKISVGPTLFKQMNIDAFLQQHKLVAQSDMSRVGELLSTHPYLVKRIQALQDFYEGPEYRRLTSSPAKTGLSDAALRPSANNSVAYSSTPTLAVPDIGSAPCLYSGDDGIHQTELPTAAPEKPEVPVRSAEQPGDARTLPDLPPLSSPLYLKAIKELDGALRMEVWELALAECGGDKPKARERYVQLRVIMMSRGGPGLENSTPNVSKDCRSNAVTAQVDKPKPPNPLLSLPITEKIYRGLLDKEIQQLQSTGESAGFLIACTRGPIGVIRTYLDKNPLFVGVTNGNGNTGLHLAILEKRHDLIELLLAAGAPVLWENNSDKSSLQLAEETFVGMRPQMEGILRAAIKQNENPTSETSLMSAESLVQELTKMDLATQEQMRLQKWESNKRIVTLLLIVSGMLYFLFVVIFGGRL
jgi:Zn-dependent protease with chaperone function